MARLLVVLWLALLAGCASVQTGMGRDQVLAAWGQPTRSVALPDGGQRLQYSQQPSGQQVYMVDLDAGGKVRSVRQVMTLRDFARIATDGSWTRADVEREFGPAPDRERVASWDGPIMTYRLRDAMTDLYFWVYLDSAGVVRRAHQGMDLRSRRYWIH